MLHVIGAFSIRIKTAHYNEWLYACRKVYIVYCLIFLLSNVVSAQNIVNEVFIIPNDSSVVLKKRNTSVPISITLKNRSNADTLVISNFMGFVHADLWFFPPDSPFLEHNCKTSHLFFRIEDINGTIVQPYSINSDPEISTHNYALEIIKYDSPREKASKKDKQNNKCKKGRDLVLIQDTTLILCPQIKAHFALTKGTYNLYIYYCNIYDKTYRLKYEPKLIKAIPSVTAISKKIFIGHFSTKAIKLVVK